MKKQLIVAAAALAIAITGVRAADLPVIAPPVADAPAPVDDWSGFYIGIHGGYGFGQTDMSINGGAFATEYDIDGWLAGGQVGFNFVSGMWLFGVEGDIAYSTIDGSYTDTAAFDQTAITEIDWLATIRARAGLHYDRWMPYITGGVAFAGVDHTITPTGIVVLGASLSDTLVGWTVGAGVEAMIDPNWTAKLEYLYVDLEDTSFTSGGDFGTFDENFHVVRAGLNFHF